ncbi:hypothetical protein GCM10011363_45450 [Marivita lacus]|uniref:Glycosyltransferase n=1 Tax=Marivita lacus TaxID=1323742 RepID=A0ABQ1LHC5_9RHOB|nr:glycosyltransferase [Marivita lacus]GGC23813.1 hypothetical protein GCM10011363_45450 [Marivita lacus]
MRITILTRQIGHYHDARYRGAATVIEGDVTVVATMGRGAFDEFAATDLGSYARLVLYEDRATYDVALRKSLLKDAFTRMLAESAPDVLAVAGWANAESAIALRWARANGIPTVMMSESQIDDDKRQPFREWVKGRLVRLADAALVGGPPHADYIRTLGMPEARIFQGYNAVGNAHFETRAEMARADAEALRRQHGLPEQYLLASSRFIRKKNLTTLITAHGEVFDTGGPELVILGDGEMRPEIEAARAAHPAPDNVHLPGYRGYDDLPVYYALADGFVHVASHEQWGLVINEAMACALPVIVSDRCGATRSIVSDGTSGIVTRADAPSIAAAFMQWRDLGPEGRAQMGAAAQAAIADWGPSRFGAGLRDAAEAALAAYRRRAVGLLDRALLSRIERAEIARVS